MNSTALPGSVPRIVLSLLILTLVACGGGGGGPAPVSDPLPPPAAPLAISLVSGDLVGTGNLDGTGGAARFAFPAGVAVDAAGTAYVADQGNQKIRRVTPTGEVSVLTGTETAGDLFFMHPQRDGDRSVALFNRPSGVALDAARGVLYVTDYRNLRRVTLDGTVSTVFEKDFPGAPGFFPFPSAVAVAPDGSVIVAAGTTKFSFRSCCYPTALYRFPLSGSPTLLAGAHDAAGSADGQGAAARFNSAGSLAVDKAGNVYVADSGAVRKVTPEGVVTTLAGSSTARGMVDGAGAQARFGAEITLTLDADGNLLVADANNRAIRKVTPAGVVGTVYGDVPFVAGSLAGIAVDGAGRILYTTQNGLFTAQPGNQAALVAGSAQPAAPSPFSTNLPLVRDSQGNIFRAADQTGTLSKFAADRTPLPFGPGGGNFTVPAPANSVYANSLAIDAADNLYQSYETRDGVGTNDVRVVGASIVRISPSGQTTVLASSDRSSAVPFLPRVLKADDAGSVYFIDQNGPAIRKVGPSGTLTTLADLSSVTEAGSGIFEAYFGLAVDRTSAVYLSSSARCVVYRIDSAGKPVPFAGQSGKCGNVDGPAGQAQLAFPGPPVVDSAGNLYLAQSSTIRKVTPDGTVSTFAGQAGLVGNRLGVLPGVLGSISHLWISADDVLYVVSDEALLKIPTR